MDTWDAAKQVIEKIKNDLKPGTDEYEVMEKIATTLENYLYNY